MSVVGGCCIPFFAARYKAVLGQRLPVMGDGPVGVQVLRNGKPLPGGDVYRAICDMRSVPVRGRGDGGHSALGSSLGSALGSSLGSYTLHHSGAEPILFGMTTDAQMREFGLRLGHFIARRRAGLCGYVVEVETQWLS